MARASVITWRDGRESPADSLAAADAADAAALSDATCAGERASVRSSRSGAEPGSCRSTRPVEHHRCPRATGWFVPPRGTASRRPISTSIQPVPRRAAATSLWGRFSRRIGAVSPAACLRSSAARSLIKRLEERWVLIHDLLLSTRSLVTRLVVTRTLVKPGPASPSSPTPPSPAAAPKRRSGCSPSWAATTTATPPPERPRSQLSGEHRRGRDAGVALDLRDDHRHLVDVAPASSPLPARASGSAGGRLSGCGRWRAGSASRRSSRRGRIRGRSAGAARPRLRAGSPRSRATASGSWSTVIGVEMGAGRHVRVSVAVGVRCGLEGEPDVERRAALAGVERERAAVALLDDPPGGVQAEPRALPDVLGREERLEHVGAGLGRDPRPGVGDVDHDAVAVPACAHA